MLICWIQTDPLPNRQANHALYQIVISRLASDLETKRYLERRTKEGKSIAEIVRVLKRYVAREVFKHLHQPA